MSSAAQTRLILLANQLALNMVEVNKELSAAHKKREEERKKEEAAEKSLNPEQRQSAKIEKLKKEEQELSSKIRGSIKAYKEIKAFLQQLLPKISPADDDGNSKIT